MIAFTGVHHLALATRDLDTTIRFWRDLIGLSMFLGLGRDGYRQYFFSISETASLAFFEWPDVEPIPEKDHGVPVKGPFAFDHVSIGVATDADLWELKDRLEAAGIWVSEGIDHGFIHSIYTFDPNEIPVEFSAPVPTVNLRENPVMADPVPCATAKEGWIPDLEKWPSAMGGRGEKDRIFYPGEGREVLERETPDPSQDRFSVNSPFS